MLRSAFSFTFVGVENGLFYFYQEIERLQYITYHKGLLLLLKNFSRILDIYRIDYFQDQLTKLKEASAEKRKVHDGKVNDVLTQLPEFKKQIDEILAERDTAKGDIDKKINEISQQNKRVNRLDFQIKCPIKMLHS